MEPKVSVLIPINRIDEFFIEALDSILNGIYKNLEVLVIGDSLDQDAEMRISEIVNQRNNVEWHMSPGAGLVDALNFGIHKSSGELIIRMDGDDVSLPHRIKLQVDFLIKNPIFAVVGGQVEYICQHGSSRGFSRYPKQVARYWLRKPFGSQVAHPAVAFRKSIITEVGGYRSFFKHAEDLDLWNRVLRFHKIANLPQVIIKYRQHSNQVSVKNNLAQLNKTVEAFYVDVFESYAKHKRLMNFDDAVRLGSSNEMGSLTIKGKIRLRWYNSMLATLELAADFSKLGGIRAALRGKSEEGKMARKIVLAAISKNPLLSFITFSSRWGHASHGSSARCYDCN